MTAPFWKRFLLKTGFAINIGCFVHCVTEYVAEFTMCVGPSMEPTLNTSSNGDVVVTEHVTTRYRYLKRGDIVIAKCPSNPNTMICKRIAAMGGDMVEKPNGLNSGSEDSHIKIPKGHLWLLGDNSGNSTDSRIYGPVPYGLVRGRVCFKVWPLSEFGRM
ncbi:mitochondrial inner membrane protease subunit 1-like isoform X2 [Rhopilema esculentum]|uniref:mitochondrial inner membrane protease subunit 1-like isoform X2 n=1 Tax=Rhopilema esculentum TaxID=499914 RepID=UPI0031D4F6D0